VADARYSGGVLDAAEYAKLLQPSESNPPTLYSSYETGLYAKVLMKYADDMSGMVMK